MRVFVLSMLPGPVPMEFGGGGRNRDGSNNDCTLVCFFTGVRFGDDLRLFEYDFNILALQKNKK